MLIIACINFMMLAIGRSAGRARGIGVRKVVGAPRRQLMLQFWNEVPILSVVAMGAGLVLVQFALSVFLLVNTLIKMDQLRYLRTMDLGFDKKQVVVIPVKGLDGQRMLWLFQDEPGRRSDIAGVTGPIRSRV